MKFSPSKIRAFMSCSLMAKFNYEDQIPQLQNAAASFGTAVHLALELYNETQDEQAAIDCFLYAWDNPEEFDITPQFYFPRTSYGDYRERGVKFIREYVESYKWVKRDIIATEHRFCVDIGHHQLSGVVDIIETEVGSKQLKIVDLKGLALDTPLPTPTGWTTMGEVAVGDKLFASDGTICTVTAKSDVHFNPCYRMVFDDFTEIICDHEHYWKTLSGKQRYQQQERVLTTKEIKDTLFSDDAHPQRHHRIINHDPLELPEVDLPIHPYVLGFWLGDGKHTSGEITSGDPEVFDTFRELGYRVGGNIDKHSSNCETRSVYGLKGHLVDLNLYGNKHVPEVYLRASTRQRLELLRGLMDSDGTWNKVRNQCSFTNTNLALAEAVYELVQSMGWNANFWSGPYSGFGVTGTAFYVNFVPYGMNPFCLSRKADQVRIEGSVECRRRLVQEVVPIDTVPTQCITVDSADRTYLCGKQMVVTHNTGQRPNAKNLHFDVQFCADSETQILTRRGWKDYCEVIEGEDVLTYNAETDLAEWQPALAVNVFDAVDQELVSIESLSHSSLTTKNHRWYVDHGISSRGSWRREKRIVTSDALTDRDSIPCGRRVSNLPETAKYDDDFVALVGWFWTEGHVISGGSLSLAQKDGSDYQDIYNLLERLWGPPAENMRNGGQPLPFPAWRVALADDANRFYLNRTASLELYVAFEDLSQKVLCPDFITSLTEDQLRLFIDVSIRADGHKGPTGVRTITQSIRSRLDAFAIACQLAGIRTSLSHRKLGGKGNYADSDIWTLVLKEGRPNFTPSKKKQSLVSYTGKVWCPTTANGTWLARRNGAVYFTGNTSYLYAAQQKQFWCGYEPEIDKYKGFENGEELWERYKDYEFTGVWYDLRNAKEYPVGPRTQLDYQKLYRCLDSIARVVELDAYMPDISGDTCGICSYKDICPLYEIPESNDGTTF